MILFHYTSTKALRPIARHGLTVGDVPTDIENMGGIVGVWLTSADHAEGHGLTGGALDKQRCRLAVHVEDGDPKLHRWSEWGSRNATATTLRILAKSDGASSDSWFIYLGWIKPERIRGVVDLSTGQAIDPWGDAFPKVEDVKGVPYWDRARWHKALLKQIARRVQR